MLPLHVGPADHPLSVLALGAHCDDVEIGAGGLLLTLAGARPVSVQVSVLSGAGTPRAAEAQAAGRALCPGAQVEVHDLPDGHFPAHWGRAKLLLADLAERCRPDVILAPHAQDAHQDHRLLAELVTQVWRGVLVLGYEIPKWDAEVTRPNVYLPLSAAALEAKWQVLDGHFASQRGKPWWDREVVAGLARLRGVECSSTYAEAFTVTKAVLQL